MASSANMASLKLTQSDICVNATEDVEECRFPFKPAIRSSSIPWTFVGASDYCSDMFS